jgi:hypothetical protein
MDRQNVGHSCLHDISGGLAAQSDLHADRYGRRFCCLNTPQHVTIALGSA